ncbi:response regulator transcription factor [Pseudomonas capeferrum]|uniref:response regulator transcription factor n=1 Tax=Pseudomonas capeferrum TaxID=1495066 RepID=UPI00280AD52C|nr:response regulator [Pseudomonas capeferrum]
MLIDDSPDELCSLLTQAGLEAWKISVCSEPHQGLQRALALRPNLILLDVHMPKMNGFSVCRLLREAPATRDIPVIFLTSASQLEQRLEGLSLGGVDYVLKPFSPEEVIARIRIHLQLTWRMPLIEDLRQSAETDNDQVLLDATVRYIDEHLADLPSLENIAKAVGTHEKRLSVLFRQRLGTTVFAFVRSARLRKGQALLRNSAMSIQDIAAQVGFRSACNFTTAFREKRGMTPREFRSLDNSDPSPDS